MTAINNQESAPYSLIGFGFVLLSAALFLVGCAQSVLAAGSSVPEITVSSFQTSVRAGGLVLLSATQAGTAITGGDWTVLGGPSDGTVDGSIYHAPITVPPAGHVVLQYLYKDTVHTITLSVLNPVPSISSVNPSVFSGMSTQIMVTGANFLQGSQITVNGGVIPTIYADAEHLTGNVLLPAGTGSTTQIAVMNPDPGSVLSSGLSVRTTPAPLPGPTLPTSTLHTPSYFTEQSDEFVGPFPSWTNVKTAYGAVGDGVADDTAAIQMAITSITDTSASSVVWLPAGTYKITRTLVFGHMRNFSFIGEDPRSTILKWAGAQGGTMMQTDGSTYFKISRVNLDGSGIADIGGDLTTVSTYQDAYYSTFNELSDLHIQGVKLGLHLGIDAETTVERVFFDHLSIAGFTVDDFNTLNIFINDSLFVECGTGLTDAYQNGAGSFIVSNSYFVRSQVADMSIANTGLFSARHNTSVGSKAFFLSLEIYDNSASITLQNNTILDPTSTPFQFGNLGPFMLIDNVVRLQDDTIPVIEASWTPSYLKDVFSMGNVYTPNGGIGTGNLPFQGRVVSYDDMVVPLSSIGDVTVPSNVYVPPNLHRSIFEVGATTGAGVQAAINLAAESGSLRPVVHLTRADYPVSSTITFPVGSDIQLIGDDVTTSSLSWQGSATGPVLALPTSSVSVKNLRINGSGQGSSDGILLKISDEPNMQVIMDQAELGLGANNTYSVNFDGMEHATAEMFSTYTLGSITGVKVTGGAFRAAKEATLGITNHYTGSLQSVGTSTSFDVSAGGKYMVQDNFHDGGATSPQNFKLSGTGTVTEQGGVVYMNSTTPFEIDSFSGNVTLMGLVFTGGFNLASTKGQANLLNLGLIGNSSTYLPSSTANITVGNVLNSYNGGHIAQTTTPDVAWMRGMLAQTRSEYPIARPPLASGANRIRLNRLSVNSTLSAVHLTPDAAKTGLYYVLRSGLSTLANTSGACVGTTFLNANNQWLLTAAGEGDFEILSADSGKALGFAASSSHALTLEAITGLYDQRWMINKAGDGSLSMMNRQTGTLLSLPAQGGCAGIDTGGSTNWTITAY